MNLVTTINLKCMNETAMFFTIFCLISYIYLIKEIYNTYDLYFGTRAGEDKDQNQEAS